MRRQRRSAGRPRRAPQRDARASRNPTCTGLPRRAAATLLDLATVEPAASLERIVAEALVRRLLDADQGGHRARQLARRARGPDSTDHAAGGRLRSDATRRPASRHARRRRTGVESSGPHGHRLPSSATGRATLAHTLAGWTVARFTAASCSSVRSRSRRSSRRGLRAGEAAARGGRGGLVEAGQGRVDRVGVRASAFSASSVARRSGVSSPAFSSSIACSHSAPSACSASSTSIALGRRRTCRSPRTARRRAAPGGPS